MLWMSFGPSCAGVLTSRLTGQACIRFGSAGFSKLVSSVWFPDSNQAWVSSPISITGMRGCTGETLELALVVMIVQVVKPGNPGVPETPLGSQSSQSPANAKGAPLRKEKYQGWEVFVPLPAHS